MNESVLNALMKLFAIIVDEQKVGFEVAARDVVASYLEKQFNKEWLELYLDNFDKYLEESHAITSEEDPIDIKHKQVARVCAALQEEVEQEQKVWIMLQLIEFINDSEFTGPEELRLVKTVSKSFHIPKEEFEFSHQFIIGSEEEMPYNEHLLIIDSNEDFQHDKVKHIYSAKMRSRFFILHLESTNSFLMKYFGKNNLYLNGHNIKLNRSYLLAYGSVIRSHRVDPIYYSQIAAAFMEHKNSSHIRYVAKDIEYRFPASQNGLYPVNFELESGQLIGVMGGSGTGKSTLLNVLNGNLPLKGGDIYINGYHLTNDKEKLNGVIGYVPQDDLLIEELSVYENLYYNAKLCFTELDEERIDEIIDTTIENFDLVEARDLKVGNPINKVLSGGQRKRLNIALELMREPSILFVDEPTSGLSSMDSEKVMLLLKRQVLKAKLVVCNIHQPSSDIFKLLDKLIIMDQGGKVIYFGNPIDAVVYFKTQTQYVKANESECLACGNVNSEQILRIVEARMMNEYGKQIRKRKRNSEEWYKLYKKNIEDKQPVSIPKHKRRLPLNQFSIPGRLEQLKIYLSRDIKAKISNTQYTLITLLEAPLLAVILGYFTKYISGNDLDSSAYVFANNENIPSFIFMSVVVSLFLGLIISAEEILHDQRIMKRESFLNLSRFSYLNAKVLVMLAISFIQTLLFVGISTQILEIKGLSFEYWLILYTASACANLIGLNLSAALNTVVAVYVSIPFILVPQLLFSGVIVNFNKLHPAISSQKYVPAIGDLMTSRWAYEALVVTQFKDNKFEQSFFNYEQNMSRYSYQASYLIPELKQHYENWLMDSSYKDSSLVKNEFNELAKFYTTPANISLKQNSLLSNSEEWLKWLDQIKREAWRNYTNESFNRDSVYESLYAEYGGKKEFFDFKQEHHNKAIEQLVLNRREMNKIVTLDGEFIQMKDPVFQFSENQSGRTQLYASQKRIGNFYISTFWFNIMVIWIKSILFYICLYFDIFRKLFHWIEIIWLKIIPEGDLRIKLKRQ